MFSNVKKLMGRLFVLVALVGCLAALTSGIANAGSSSPCCQNCQQQYSACLSECNIDGDPIELAKCVKACSNERRACIATCPGGCN